VQEFHELTVDDSLAKKISFPVGERVYLVKRLRLIDGKAMMSDTSYFKKSIVKGLNEKIIAGSIYDHIKQNLDFKIAASKSIMKVESAKDSDFKELALGKNNCVGILENAVYNDMGKLFEYTTIRYIPNEYALISFDQN
jgi:GntR family trehalose operon transcriptional repressor